MKERKMTRLDVIETIENKLTESQRADMVVHVGPCQVIYGDDGKRRLMSIDANEQLSAVTDEHEELFIWSPSEELTSSFSDVVKPLLMNHSKKNSKSKWEFVSKTRSLGLVRCWYVRGKGIYQNGELIDREA